MATQTQLRDELLTAIKTQLAASLPADTVWESRYTPHIEAEAVKQLHIVAMLLDVSTEIIAREVDTDEFVIGIAVQQKVRDPKATDVASYGDNVTAVDELISIVESIKSLFRGDGALRHEHLADCYFAGLKHEMQFEPLHLVQYGVFTSIVEFTYRSEETEEL